MVEYVTEVEVLGGECGGERQRLQRILEIVDEYEETIMGMIDFLLWLSGRCKMECEALKVWKADAREREDEREGYFDCEARQMGLPARQRRCKKCAKEFGMEFASVVPIDLEFLQHRHGLKSGGDPGRVLPQSLLKSGLCCFPCVVGIYRDFHESHDGFLSDASGRIRMWMDEPWANFHFLHIAPDVGLAEMCQKNFCRLISLCYLEEFIARLHRLFVDHPIRRVDPVNVLRRHEVQNEAQDVVINRVHDARGVGRGVTG